MNRNGGRPGPALASLLALAATLAGCGYRIAGQADLLPAEIATIAIPAFENATTRYKLTQELPEALTRELIQRTRYRVVPRPEDADATLFGSVVNYYAYPAINDAQSGRATGMQVLVVLDVRLVRKGTGEMLYRNAALTFQNRYEISPTQSGDGDRPLYFEESDTALQRVSEGVARTVVSAILENF